jgi:hypothetical protein
MPVANAVVSIKKEGKKVAIDKPKRKAGARAIVVVTDVNGVALFDRVKPGRYKGEVTVDGVKVFFGKEVRKGGRARLIVVC